MCLLVLFWAGTGCLFLFSFVSTNNYFLCSQTLWVFVVICSFLTGSQVSYNDYSCVRLSLGFIRLLSHVARPHHCRTSTEPEQSLGESLLMFSWFLSNVLQLEQNTFIATHKIPWPAASNGRPIFTGIQRKISCHPLPGSPPKARAWPCDIRCKSEWLVESMHCGGVIWGPPSSFTCIPLKMEKWPESEAYAKTPQIMANTQASQQHITPSSLGLKYPQLDFFFHWVHFS